MKCITLILLAALFTACAQEKKPDESSSLRVTKASTETSSRVADCTLKFKNSGLCFSYYWEKTPNENEEGTLIFKVYHASKLDQTVVMNALSENPDVFLWMPSMGHGSTQTQLDFIDTGTYRVSKVYFIMPGAWEIHFKIKTVEAGIEEQMVPVTY